MKPFLITCFEESLRNKKNTCGHLDILDSRVILLNDVGRFSLNLIHGEGA